MNAHQRRKFAKALMDDLRNATDDEKLQGLVDAVEEHRRDQRQIKSLERELVFTRDVIRHLVDEAKLTSSQYELCRQALQGKKP